jgi:intracellular sulfur oxidation DsrE/DsrF family protein
MYAKTRANARLFSLVAVATLLLVPISVHAQSASPAETDAPKTAYFVRSADHLPVILMSARTSLATDSDAEFTASAADVVVVGAAVKGLVADGPHVHKLKKSLHSEVRVVACEVAMNNTGVTESDLIEGVDTAANGFHELLRLQSNGYITVDL